MSTATWDVPFRQTDKRELGPVIYHLAERETSYSRALCGTWRSLPLEPNAQGELCVVCSQIYWEKHGVEYHLAGVPA